MLQKNLNKWSLKLNLWEVEWGMSHSQATFWLHKQKSTKHSLIFTNWVANYDFFCTDTSKSSWEYYYRRLNETRLQLEWYRFVALWRRLKWQQRQRNVLLYTDIFEDYPLVRHLSKLTNELYSVGWYPGLLGNRRKLLKLRYSYLLGKTEMPVLPSIVILFSTFYPITHQFLKELGSLNIYYILFASISDYRNMWCGSYAIFMTKNYVNYYYYYYLIYRVLCGDLLENDLQQSGNLPSKRQEFKQAKSRKIIRWKVYIRFRIWKSQLKAIWYRSRELKQQRRQRFWNQYLVWCLLKSKQCKIRAKKPRGVSYLRNLKRTFLRNAVKRKRSAKKIWVKTATEKFQTKMNRW